MSVLHLLWIIPIVATFGFVVGAVLSWSKEEEIKETLCLLIKNLESNLETARNSSKAARELGDESTAYLYEGMAKAFARTLDKIKTLVNNL